MFSRFRSSSSAFYTSSIQLDVPCAKPSATTSALCQCISVRRSPRYVYTGRALGMGEIYELCGNLDGAHGYAHAHETHRGETTTTTRDRGRSLPRFFYSSVIKQFNITNTGLGQCRAVVWEVVAYSDHFASRTDLYCPDSCVVVPSLSNLAVATELSDLKGIALSSFRVRAGS